MTEFLTVKEAARRTGKSPSSIRRLIYPILAEDQHPDRPQIQPGVDETLRLRMQGDNFAWRVGDELLQRLVPAESLLLKDRPAASKSAGDAEGDLLAMLKGELEIKNQQITQQSETIAKLTELTAGLSERMHESNVLIAGLQRQLSLSDGRDRTPKAVVETVPVPAEEGSLPAEPPKTPKRGVFSRLFH